MTALKAAEALASGQPPNLNTGLIALCIVLLGMMLRDRLANRKMTIEDNAGLRKEFIDEMRDLRVEVKALRDENSDLRAEVRGLHGVIDAMRQANRSTQDMVAMAIANEDEAVIRTVAGQLNIAGGRP